jgi:UPF0716 family protein affecting phage T7 exclusion
MGRGCRPGRYRISTSVASVAPPARYVVRVLLRILFALLGLQVLDLVLLVVLSRSVGFWPTVIGLMLMGFLGTAFARREGGRVWRSFQGRLAAGQPPEHGVIDGALVLLGSVLLILPGILSDVVGVLLFISPLRHALAEALKRRLTRELEPMAAPFAQAAAPRFGGEPNDRHMDQGASVIDTTGVESPD